MSKREYFVIKVKEISEKYNLNIDVFNEILELYNSTYDFLELKINEINMLQNELDRTKINTNIQNKEIAIKLLEIRQNGINKCYDKCLSENGVIQLYKEYLEALNQ